MTDIQFNTLMGLIKDTKDSLNQKIDGLKTEARLTNEDENLSKKINTIYENLNEKIDLLKLDIEDKNEINNRQHQDMIYAMEKRYQDLDRRIKEINF